MGAQSGRRFLPALGGLMLAVTLAACRSPETTALVSPTAPAIVVRPSVPILVPTQTEPPPPTPSRTASPTAVHPSTAPPAPTHLPTRTPLLTEPAATPSSPPTALPTATSSPAPTRTPALPQVAVSEGSVDIATYPYAGFLSQAWSETYRMAYDVLNRDAYQASNPVPQPVTYRTVVLENEYLRLTFLPELGGRLYEVLFKPTGNRQTYRNPVLKPSPWGPAEQGWWLAAGGFEWCLPVEEHGYEWGVSWDHRVQRDASGATVFLTDTQASDRVRAEVAVRLEAGTASFTIRPRLENPTGAPLAVKYWTNAMLAPGGRNSPSAGLLFVLPDAVSSVTVHSRGDETLPGAGQRMTWPMVSGRDWSRLGNWTRWLGFFEDPATGEFAAVYDEHADEGMVRVGSPERAPGVKVFAFGWSDPIPAGNWTDDGSAYVELHAGPAPTFDDSVTLAAGESLEWTETWYPVAGLGGLRYATGLAAIHLAAGGGQARWAVAVTRRWEGRMALHLDGQEIWQAATWLEPGPAYRNAMALQPNAPQVGRLMLRLLAADGSTEAEYGAEFALK